MTAHPQPTWGRGKRHFALGRREPGAMNKTEARYEAEVLKPALLGGHIDWYAFECIKLKLAPKTFFTPDFAQQGPDGFIDLIDVKGAPVMIEEDARVKIKVAASLFPFRFAFAWPVKGQGWKHETIGGTNADPA